MSEEEEKKEEEVKKPEVEQEPEYTEVEQIAMKIGWNPNHDGERKYVSAEDFLLRSKEIQDTMSKEMRSQNKKLADLERGIQDLKNHNETVYRAQVAKLKSEIVNLSTKRKQAIEDGDDKAVGEIDAQMERIRKLPDDPPETASSAPNPVFEAWREKNAWYDNNSEMKAYADAQGDAPEFKGLPFNKLLDKVTERVQKMFPDEFPKPAEKPTPKAPTVEGAQPRKSKQNKTKHTFNDLSDEQKKLCKEFVHMGVMTEEQYIKDLEDAGQLA